MGAGNSRAVPGFDQPKSRCMHRCCQPGATNSHGAEADTPPTAPRLADRALCAGAGAGLSQGVRVGRAALQHARGEEEVEGEGGDGAGKGAHAAGGGGPAGARQGGPSSRAAGRGRRKASRQQHAMQRAFRKQGSPWAGWCVARPGKSAQHSSRACGATQAAALDSWGRGRTHACPPGKRLPCQAGAQRLEPHDRNEVQTACSVAHTKIQKVPGQVLLTMAGPSERAGLIEQPAGGAEWQHLRVAAVPVRASLGAWC